MGVFEVCFTARRNDSKYDQTQSKMSQNLEREWRKECYICFLSTGHFFQTFNQSHINVHYKPLREVRLCGPMYGVQ